MNKIFIAGSGGIGSAAGLILASKTDRKLQIILGDINTEAANVAVEFVNSGASKTCAEAFVMSTSDDSALEGVLAECDVILDCLPGSQAPRMARLAMDQGCHYANLTEYVSETDQIMEMAKDATTGFVLQTGLAPGYINVLGHHIFNTFCEQCKVQKAETMEMKVGALSQHASSPHYYAFTWSPVGVATEYVKDAYVVQNGELTTIPSLSNTTQLVIDGKVYEDDFTSGGAADLPQALSGRIESLSYKTLRYVGHYDWVRGVLESTTGDNKIANLQETMLNAIPMVEDDIVIVYASVSGRDKYGNHRAVQKSIEVKPIKIGSHVLRAIQTTTAAPLCQVALDLLDGKYTGVVLQSQIDTSDFLNSPLISEIYGAIDV